MGNSIMFLDLETENHTWYGNLASPKHPENFIVMAGAAIDQGERYMLARATNVKEAPKGWLQIPDDVWLLVCHNAPFEINWMLETSKDEFMAFLQRGGRVFCTAVGHYLLSNQQDRYPALDEVAPRYGGSTKIDAVKLLWEQGTKTSEIDPVLLEEYLLGEEGDIENTRKVFWGEYSALTERGMWGMALTRMEGMLFNACAMHFGMFVNTKKAYELLEEQEKELQALERKFQDMRADFPEEVEFKETSKHHLSAWIYGGPITYRTRVPREDKDGNVMYEKVEMYQCAVDPEKYITPEEYEKHEGKYEVVLFKSGKNRGLPKPFRVDTDVPQTKWGEAVYQAKPIVHLEKFPQDFRDSFLREYTGKLTLRDGSPVISVSSDAINDLVARPELEEDVKEFLKSLLDYAQLDKDIGTYYLREFKNDEGEVVKRSGMLQYVTPEGIVHHSLNSTSTSTGRLSSTNPNLQNLSGGRRSKVQTLFESRFGEDGVILGADYSALEVVVLACLSGDENLKKVLLEGTDMHCLRLAQDLGEPYEEVYEKCHNSEHPDHAKYDELRDNIKPRAFAYQYGATAHGISYTCGITLEEAEKFIENEKRLFPGVEAWYNDVVFPSVLENTKYGREISPEDGEWKLFQIGTWQSPGGTTYQFRQYPKRIWSEEGQVEIMEFKPTQMRNYPVQGEAAYFVQAATGWVIRWLISNNFMGGKALPINTIHDAVYLDVHKDVLPGVAAAVKSLMEYIPEGMKSLGYNLDIPFPVEVSYGPSMGESTVYQEN